jgi:hypothetical protein
MRTLGIDLAAQPEKTAACSITWSPKEARIDAAKLGVTDDDLTQLAETAERIGLDVPFGWPTKFVTVVSAHHQGMPCEEFSRHDLRFRATDHHVRRITGKWPLSVSTDRIGVPALRAIRLLCRFTPGALVDRSGAGRVVEVYPAAALIQWGFLKTNKKDFSELGEVFLARVSNWLSISPKIRESLLNDRDIFDALIACLVTRAAAVGLCDPIPAECGEVAKTEGWIALPRKGSLQRLATEK